MIGGGNLATAADVGIAIDFVRHTNTWRAQRGSRVDDDRGPVGGGPTPAAAVAAVTFALHAAVQAEDHIRAASNALEPALYRAACRAATTEDT